MQGIIINEQDVDFCATVIRESGQDVSRCYQCGKCTAGCPVSFAADFSPHQIMHMLLLNMEKEVLSSEAIWLCVYCSTCAARCPRQISVADVMDALRIIARKRKVAVRGKGLQVALFNESFLSTVESYGRSYELLSMLIFNLKNRRPFKNAGLGLKMFQRGKIRPLASKIKEKKEIERIFRQIKEARKGD